MTWGIGILSDFTIETTASQKCSTFLENVLNKTFLTMTIILKKILGAWCLFLTFYFYEVNIIFFLQARQIYFKK
jgi:hypothetical protein